jgi:uncharacterized protein YjeT (DUF2065 family)
VNAEFTQALVTGIGMVLVIERLIYAGFPGGLKNLARKLPEVPDASLRIFGVIAMIIGIALVWWSRQ